MKRGSGDGERGGCACMLSKLHSLSEILPVSTIQLLTAFFVTTHVTRLRGYYLWLLFVVTINCGYYSSIF